MSESSHIKFTFYEQFITGKNYFALFNAVVMILIAVPSLLDILRFELKASRDVFTKLFLVCFFGFPAFVLYVIRFIKGPGLAEDRSDYSEFHLSG